MGKSVIDDFKKPYVAFSSGRIKDGLIATGKPMLDILSVAPFAGVAIKGVKYGAKGISVGASKLGVFRRASAPNNHWQTAEKGFESMSAVQAKNLNRFINKLPQNSENVRVRDFLGGGKVFQGDSPAANIPGSFARYEKQVDALGNTTFYTKTTYRASGEIVHVAPKYPIGPKFHPEFGMSSRPGLN